MELDKLTLKLRWNNKWARLAKKILKNKQKVCLPYKLLDHVLDHTLKL